MDLTSLGRAFRSRRTALGMTQKQVADAAGVTYQYISELEFGTDKATLRTLLKAATALRAELRIVLDTGESPPPLSEEEAHLIARYRALDEAGRASVEQLVDQWPSMDLADARTLRGMLDLWKRSMSYADSAGLPLRRIV